MNKLLSLALLLGGVALIISIATVSNSLSADIARFFTGSPMNKAVWMLIGGAAAAVVGLTGTLRASKPN